MWGIGPYGYMQGVRGKKPPVAVLPCQPPFRQGGHGDGGTDCHDQFANWSRNDTLQGARCVVGGGVRASCPTERLQVVRQSGRTEASVPAERLHEVRWAGRQGVVRPYENVL